MSQDNLVGRTVAGYNLLSHVGEGGTATVYRAEHPQRSRELAMRSRFGIEPAQYEALLVAQGGVCAICRKPETAVLNGAPKALAVDHDHECCPGARSCGRCVRALLCQRCNHGIGQFQDDPSLLAAAIDYLQSWKDSNGATDV